MNTDNEQQSKKGFGYFDYEPCIDYHNFINFTYSIPNKMVRCSGSSFARLGPRIINSSESLENKYKYRSKNMANYKSVRIIDGKPKQVIVDENETIINRNPNREELKGIRSDVSIRKPGERYSDKELLGYMREFERQNGRVPTAKDFLNCSDYPSVPTYQEHFGSWNSALEKAGLKTNKKDEYTDDELLKSLEKFYEENGRIPSTMDFRNNPKYPSHVTFNRQFGSLEKALKLTGFDTSKKVIHKRTQYYTDEKLLQYLKDYYNGNGSVPEERDFDKNKNYPNFGTYYLRFGSWNNAITMAGLEPHLGGGNDLKYTNEEMLECLKKFYKENNSSPPSESNFINNSKYPGFVTYQRRFGSWNNAITMSGLDINVGGTPKQYTKDELLQFLVYAKEEFGRIPVETDFVNNSKYPCFTTYVRYFGSWNNALKLVGMDLDTSVKKGILDTSVQKGRMWELCVFESFEKKGAVDHSGNNLKSSIDGTCPNNQDYDAKVAKLIGDSWPYDLRRGDRSKIKWFYLGAFDKDYINLKYAWRIPENFFICDTTITIGLYNNRKYNIENLKVYEITDKIVDTFKKMAEKFGTIK